MKTLDFEEQTNLLRALKRKDLKAFSRLYHEFSEDLLLLAYSLVGDGQVSHQKVEQLFTNLWEENRFGNITPPIHNYLFTELRKFCQSSGN